MCPRQKQLKMEEHLKRKRHPGAEGSRKLPTVAINPLCGLSPSGSLCIFAIRVTGSMQEKETSGSIMHKPIQRTSIAQYLMWLERVTTGHHTTLLRRTRSRSGFAISMRRRRRLDRGIQCRDIVPSMFRFSYPWSRECFSL